MHSLIEANRLLLLQAVYLLEVLDDSGYRTPSPECFNSSAGGHMRHVLEHYKCFCDGFESGFIDYEARERGSPIESSVAAATELALELAQKIAAIADADAHRPLRVLSDDGGELLESHSSVQRELQFILSHTVHHFALVKTLLAIRGHTDFPPDFGMAPSTLRYLQQA